MMSKVVEKDGVRKDHTGSGSIPTNTQSDTTTENINDIIMAGDPMGTLSEASGSKSESVDEKQLKTVIQQAIGDVNETGEVLEQLSSHKLHELSGLKDMSASDLDDLLKLADVHPTNRGRVRKALLPYIAQALNLPASPPRASSHVISSQNFTPNAKKMFENRTMSTEELQKKFDAIDAKLSRIAPQSSEGPTTFADWWIKHRPAAQTDFINESDENLFEDLSCGAGSSETDVVQPLWDRTCKKLKNKHLQQIPTSKHKTPSIGTWKPDGPIYIAQRPQTEFYMSIVGEMKGGLKEGFTAEHFGQLASFLAALLAVTVRDFVYGFLCDGHIIQFMTAKLDAKGGFSVSEVSPSYFLNMSGGKRLTWLLRAQPAQLGFRLYDITHNGKTVAIQRLLGRGGSSIAYYGELEGNGVVVKIYSAGTAAMDKEKTILGLLDCMIPAVPEIVGLSDTQDALLLTPVAAPFFSVGRKNANMVELRSMHIAELIIILKGVHEEGIIHRDVTLTNFFCIPEKHDLHVLLNDWSSAYDKSTEDSEKEFAGTYLYAPDAVLQLLVESEAKHCPCVYEPQFWHDLESAIKCLYLSMYPFCTTNVNVKNPADVLEMWKERFKYGVWRVLIRSARACLYEQLAKDVAVM